MTSEGVWASAILAEHAHKRAGQLIPQIYCWAPPLSALRRSPPCCPPLRPSTLQQPSISDERGDRLNREQFYNYYISPRSLKEERHFGVFPELRHTIRKAGKSGISLVTNEYYYWATSTSQPPNTAPPLKAHPSAATTNKKTYGDQRRNAPFRSRHCREKPSALRTLVSSLPGLKRRHHS